MKHCKVRCFLLAVLVLVGGCITVYVLVGKDRPAPIPQKKKIYEGVTYHRVVRFIPRAMIVHVLVIDTKAGRLEFLVTPPDSEEGPPLRARTTSQFLDEFDLQIAVNGDGFFPWWSRNPADYYPHVGDPVTPNGFAASRGKVYSDGIEPSLFISRRNALTFLNKPGNVFNAISGDRMVVLKGERVPGLDNKELEPRTAIGTNKNGRYLILIVVDGRQPYYSSGATFLELAELLLRFNAYYGMALDGGGSSTMVIEGDDGQPIILNSPIDNYIPSRERPVANHLGVYIR